MKKKQDETKWVFYIMAILIAAIVIVAGMGMILYFTQGQCTSMMIAFFTSITIIVIVAITKSTKGISDIIKSLAEWFDHLRH